MDQMRQEAYAKYQNYTNKTLWTILDGGEATEVEAEVIRMIIQGRTK